MPFDAVTTGGVADVAQMNMSGEQHICAAAGERLHRHLSAPEQVVLVVSRRNVKRVVRNDDLRHPLFERAHPLADQGNLFFVDPAALEGQRPRSVDADDSDLIVPVEGREVVGDEAAIIIERRQETCEEVVEWHVVVAGDDDLRPWQAFEESARFPKLFSACALCQIAGDDDERRLQFINELNERIDELVIDAPEVDVGEVDENPHSSGFSFVGIFAPRH